MKIKFRKLLLPLIACLLTITTVVGVTYAAWTRTHEDSFNLKITLENAYIDLSVIGNSSNMPIVPGMDIIVQNAPTVTVLKDTTACYVFVEVEKSDNFDTYMYFYMADGWTALEGVSGVYYRVNESKVTAEAGESFAIIRNNKIDVREHVTRDIIAQAADVYVNFKAYAVQKSSETPDAATAWATLGIQ